MMQVNAQFVAVNQLLEIWYLTLSCEVNRQGQKHEIGYYRRTVNSLDFHSSKQEEKKFLKKITARYFVSSPQCKQ